ncbi:MAG: T9SS type A sorting domain-containing protein [Flavipsychrobacter sp.]|nr:T9SS type A sorting domain-containing protein [Flavipsychrobacter sp.]
MRPFILLQLAAILFFCSASAQQYRPFPYGNAWWTFTYGSKPSNVNNYATYEDMYIATGTDTIIAGKTYQKISKRTFMQTSTIGFPQLSNGRATTSDKYAFGIREDNKRIYICDMDTFESILWDFNKTIGDTIKHITEYNTGNSKLTNAIITSTDSVSIGGIYRKRFLTNDPKVNLIDGLGVNGFLFYYGSMMTVYGGTPLCYTENNITYNPFNTSCIYIYSNQTPTAINNTTTNNPANIYPNPFSNQLTVDADAASVKLTDAMGKGVTTQLGNNNTINTSELPAGLYILTLHDDSGNVTERRKLIKE